MTATLDSSSRFIIGTEAAYVRNLAALWAVDAELARAVEGVESSYEIEKTRNGEVTVRVPGNGQGWEARATYLHSKFAPSVEAEKLIAGAAKEEKICFCVFGLGLGYHVEKLFEQVSSEAKIFVFEPDLAILRTALESRDLSSLIRSTRVQFVTSDDKTITFRKLEPFISIMAMGIERVIHPASKQRNETFFAQIESNLEQFEQFVHTNVSTLILNSRKTAENISQNIGWYAATPGLAPLKNRYTKKPAVIVSAGPSLRKNKHLLKDIQDRAVIIAVQTTLQPLLEMGVEPHFVTSLDYHEICSRFFEKLPPTIRTHLVAEPKATKAVFGLHPGPISLCGNEFADGLLREINPSRERIPAGSTVAHLAYFLAEHLGCDPIIFIGQDLGFSDGLCYAPGTSYEDVWRPELSRFCSVEMKQWDQIVRDRPILQRIADHDGRPMYTEKRLVTYLHQFERHFTTSSRTIIDASEGGAMKRGTRLMPLRQAIEQYCGANLEIIRDQSRGDFSKLPKVLECLRKRREESEEIGQISRSTLPLLQEIHDNIEDQPRVNRAIAQIDQLRAHMNELGLCYDLVTQLSQTTELTRFFEDRKIKAANLTGADLQRRQVRRDIENVKAIIQAAEEFSALMVQVIDELSATKGSAR